MKRSNVLAALFSVGILVFSVIIEAGAVSPTENINDEIGFMPEAIQSGEIAAHKACVYVRIAPVFGATGAVVSVPTGTTLIPNQSSVMAIRVICPNVKIAPVFNATGAIVSDPTGTILNASQSGDTTVLPEGMNVKIAPIFDASGAVVSDPTGTILSVINPN